MEIIENANNNHNNNQNQQQKIVSQKSTTPTLQLSDNLIPPPSSQVSTPISQSKMIQSGNGSSALNVTTPKNTPSSANNLPSQMNKRKETLEAKRERKAAKTLAIITGKKWKIFVSITLVNKNK